MYQYTLLAELADLKNEPHTSHPNNIIPFSRNEEYTGKLDTHEHSRNNVAKGGHQEVFAITHYEDILSVGRWLLENKEPKYFAAFTLGINIGLRANELLDLHWRDILDSDGAIRYTDDTTDISDALWVYQSKTDKNRPIFLNKACVDLLTWYREQPNVNSNPNSYLFPNRVRDKDGNKQGLSVDIFRKALKEASATCGIKFNVGTHSCRKTFGYHARMAVDNKSMDGSLGLEAVQALFGHSSSRITMRYIGLDKEFFKKVYHSLDLNLIRDLGLSKA